MESQLTSYLHELKEYPTWAVFSEITIHTRNCAGETPLHFASIQGRADIVALLLREGADPNLHGEHGYTPILEAIGQQHTEVVKLLITSGADPAITNSWNQDAWDLIELDDTESKSSLLAIVGKRPKHPNANKAAEATG